MPRLRKSSPHTKEFFDGKHRFEHWYRDNTVYFITSRCKDGFLAFATEEAKAVYFFTVEALAYFLPAFMMAAMNERSGEWDLSEHALIGIRRLFEDDSRRALLISPVQLEAIRAFLLVMRAKADTKEAMQDVMSFMALLPAQQP
jgi:hypothetical protein